MTKTKPRIVVAAAVVQRDDTYLLTRRLKGTHLEGLWEFPGGKCEPGETLEACLEREIDEELGATVRVNGLLLTTDHEYETRHIELHFFACTLDEDPHPRLGQEIRWATRAELRDLPFPAADAELIEMLSKQDEAARS